MTDPLHNKTVVILGFARQGRALARWLPTIGARAIVSDARPADEIRVNPAEFPGVEFVFGGHPISLLEGCDMLCVSGGVPLDLEIVQMALRYGVPLSNDAQLFMERVPAPVLGITGSAGKTTTTTLVGEMFKKSGARTWVGGNIGDVLLGVLPIISRNDRVVMELSSFQLEIMSISPNIGAILNITPNHLDRHKTMEAYTAAKARIISHQGEDDVAVLGRDDPGARGLEMAAPGLIGWFSLYELLADGAFLAGERIAISGVCSADADGDTRIVCDRAEVKLRGEHNLSNVLAACAIAGAGGVPAEVMAEVIRAFRGVAHRLEVVRERDGVTWINDSIATAPERVIAALRAFDEPLVLLLGGRDKKLPWEAMMRLARTRCRRMIAFGEFAPGIVEAAEAVGAGDLIDRVTTLDQAVARAAEVAQPGDVVLLSPGCTSYDAYTDFAARGEHFRALVAGL